MAQQVTVTAKGLFTSPNQLGEVPDGALRQADNVVISKDGVIQPKRGMQDIGHSGITPGPPQRLFAWDGQLVAWVDGGTIGYYYNSASPYTSWGPIGGVSLVDPQRFIVSGKYALTNGDDWIYKFTKYFPDATTVNKAGLERALDIQLSLSGGAGTALNNNAAVAYRVVWFYTNPDGSEVVGPPSARYTISNTAGGPRDVTLVFTVPYLGFMVATAKRYRIYRSPEAGATDVPTDELGLVYEGTYTVGTTVTVTDTLPESFLGAIIYTAPSQGGVAQENNAPPAARDIAVFRGSTFYANATPRVVASASLIDVNAATGLVAGDTVTITPRTNGVPGTPVVFTAAAVENIAAGQFQVFPGGSSSNISDTLSSLIRVVNRSTGFGATQVAMEGPASNEFPGLVRIFSAVIASTGFTVATSRAAAFIGLPLTSDPVREGAALYWSKTDLPDAVPLLNYAFVGNRADDISRIISTRDALFIFKADGIWRLTGSGGVWDIQPLDPTTTLVAPESAVPFENAVFALCDSGVMRITESGVENISGPIYSELEPLLLPSVLATTASVAFGIAYHSDHKYILWMPSAAGDTVAKQAYVYDSWTNSWERWTPPSGVTGFYHGLVNPADDRLYMTDGTNIWQERRTGSSADHTDGASSAITTTVKWAPRVGGNPGAMHRFREVSLHFRKVQFGTATLGFSTDVSPSEETLTLTGSEYGCDTAERGQTVIRALVPLEKARGSQLNIRFSSANAGMGYELEGMSVVFNPGSTRVGR